MTTDTRRADLERNLKLAEQSGYSYVADNNRRLLASLDAREAVTAVTEVTPPAARKERLRKLFVEDIDDLYPDSGVSWRQANRDKLKDEQLRHGYGITLEQYNALRDHQGGQCAGCGAHPEVLYVDHDHACCEPSPGGRMSRGCGSCVRGLVCPGCNVRDSLAGQPGVDWAALSGGSR